jgi:hypothetical protein
MAGMLAQKKGVGSPAKRQVRGENTRETTGKLQSAYKITEGRKKEK